MDTLGTIHPELARGHAPIAFTHHHVELAHTIPVTTPLEPMLCTLAVAAMTPRGETVAANFVQHFVTAGPLPRRVEQADSLILREPISGWASAAWASGSTREEAEAQGYCFGRGTGFFEWRFQDEQLKAIARADRIRLLCEVSGRREDIAQTGVNLQPTQFELFVNEFRVHREVLPDHPHDSRGALSYCRGGHGAYGYLMRTTLEGELLGRVAQSAAATGELRFRCAVPGDAAPAGGLTVYGHDTGRFPIGPTVIVEWGRHA
jgi:hypothetical protein